MEKCPVCHMHKVKERTVRDSNGKVTETASVCKNCGHVVRLSKKKF